VDAEFRLGSGEYETRTALLSIRNRPGFGAPVESNKETNGAYPASLATQATHPRQLPRYLSALFGSPEAPPPSRCIAHSPIDHKPTYTSVRSGLPRRLVVSYLQYERHRYGQRLHIGLVVDSAASPPHSPVFLAAWPGCHLTSIH
jgi:hypothetical protein